MGQGFAPPANSNLMQSANMLRIQPNTYGNRMEGQHNTRTAQAQFNTPRQMNMQPQNQISMGQSQFNTPQQMNMQPQMNPQQQMAMVNPYQNAANSAMTQPFTSSLNPYLPQNQQQLSGGLASLPGAAQFGKGIV